MKHRVITFQKFIRQSVPLTTTTVEINIYPQRIMTMGTSSMDLNLRDLPDYPRFRAAKTTMIAPDLYILCLSHPANGYEQSVKRDNPSRIFIAGRSYAQNALDAFNLRDLDFGLSLQIVRIIAIHLDLITRESRQRKLISSSGGYLYISDTALRKVVYQGRRQQKSFGNTFMKKNWLGAIRRLITP